MGRIAKWLSSKINTFIEGTVEGYLNEKFRSYLYGPSGDDSPPLSDDRVLIVKVDGEGKFTVSGVLCNSQGANPGEKILYSRDSNGSVQAVIKLLSSGVIELNGNSDFAVAFNDLKSGFDTLKGDFNGHTHAVTTAPGTTATPTIPSAASIDAAKVEEVKLP